MPELDDQQLLAEFTSTNSEAAFAALVGRYVNLVYSTALRFAGNPQAAEEISQAVFIILARKAAGLGRNVVLSGWLYQTARLTAANYVKQDFRRQRREQEAYMQSTLNEPNKRAWEDIAPLLDEAMGGLGETDRSAIVLRFFENKSSREVAAALKMSEAAAHMRVHRALEKLHKFLTKRGVASTTAIIAGTVSANSVHAAPVGLANTLSTIALAKSAAASTSTLTLAKGALKLMAWSKTKTSIVGVAVALLLGIGITTVVVNVLLPVPSIQGTWEGTLDMPDGIRKGEPAKLPFVLRITETNGGYQASLGSIDQADQSFDAFTYKYPYLNGKNKGYDFLWVGKINRSGEKITWTIPSKKYAFPPMVFKRTTNPTPFPEALADPEFVPRAGSDLQGFWAGKVGRGNGAVPIQIKIAEASDGTFRADFYSPKNAGTNRMPMTVSYDGTTVKLIPMDGQGMIEGHLRNGGSEITGSWIQGGRYAPTTLTQANYSDYQVPGAK